MISEMINLIGNPYPSRKIALLTVNGNHIEPEILTYIHSPRGVPGLLSPPLRCEFIVSTTLSSTGFGHSLASLFDCYYVHTVFAALEC